MRRHKGARGLGDRGVRGAEGKTEPPSSQIERLKSLIEAAQRRRYVDWPDFAREPHVRKGEDRSRHQ